MKKTTYGAACAALLCLFSFSGLQAQTAKVQYKYEDGGLSTTVTALADSVGTNTMTARAGSVQMVNSATSLLGLAGYYDGTAQTVMTSTTGANIGTLASFGVSGWINPTATTSNVNIAGNRYGTGGGSSGWDINLTRCNINPDVGPNNMLRFTYSNTAATVVQYDLSNINVPGTSLGWHFFMWMGTSDGNGTLTLDLFIGDTLGNLFLADTATANSGNGDNATSIVGFGTSPVKGTTDQYQGAMDEMTIWDNSMSYTLDVDGSTVIGGQLYDYYQSMIQVPEPAYAGALLGLLGLAVAIRRRR